MLVLDRKIHEGFWVEDRIFVKVLSIGRRRVKLGIEAPGDSTIIRDELRDAPVGAKATPDKISGSIRSARGQT